MIAGVGVSAGLTIGLTAYRDSQRQIDTFDGVPIPGTLSVQLDEPDGRVVNYEGDETVRFDDVTIAITDPAGTPVEVDRYEGEMIYDAPDSTPVQPHGTPCANARRRMPWIRRTVAGASGAPRTPPPTTR